MTGPSQAFEQALQQMLHKRTVRRADGFDNAQRQSMQATPARWWRAIEEMTCGYDVDVAALLAVQFEGVPSDQMVVLRNVQFVSLCEHHLFPFSGSATVAYMPRDNRVVGLSKLARLVEAHAQRLQVQERMTFDIADDLRALTADTACVVQAQHACMSCRGIRKHAQMRTSALFGAFRTDRQVRDEFFKLAE